MGPRRGSVQLSWSKLVKGCATLVSIVAARVRSKVDLEDFEVVLKKYVMYWLLLLCIFVMV